MNNMIEVLGEMYYIDLKNVGEAVDLKSTEDSEGNDLTINVVSFEVIKMMLEIIMTERDEIDETLGVRSIEKLSIPFKLAFNTLLKHEILKHL